MKLAYLQNTLPNPARFCTATNTTKYSSWVVQTHEQEIQGYGRLPFWK